ncbi:hypothetical protein [Methylobacterium sp. WSM2598]|uniref:hypothetical protein n=1 Tax=Methylobacterium sp. WSM2598 TaxID=398261 RepID=UPI00036EAB40|nr:hypothetical protein [Methylobacterium sp. WSM2598]
MTRPHETHADAVRAARRIVDECGARLAQAIRRDEAEAIADACHDLVARIAEAIVEAEAAAAEPVRHRAAPEPDRAHEGSSRFRNWPVPVFGLSTWASFPWTSAPAGTTDGTDPRAGGRG